MMQIMSEQERWREMWDLPEEFLDMHEDAIAAEVGWHIFDVFGYETGVLESQDWTILLRMFYHEHANQSESIYRTAACRAFSRFVDTFGGVDAFGLRPDVVADWIPCEKEFEMLDFDTD